MVETIIEKKKSYIPEDAKVEVIPMPEIFHDTDFNCRGEIAPIDVIELAQNIKQTGLIQPIILQPYSGGPPGTKYRIVAGYRRHMAHKVNCAETIKAIIIPGLSDIDAKVINLSENLNRQDLTLLQESKAVYELVKQGFTQQEMADALRVSRSWVQIRLYTLRLPLAIQEDIRAGWVKAEHIITLNGMNETDQYEAVKLIKDRKTDEGMRARVKINKNSIKKDPKKAAKRTPGQIQKMLDHILDNVKGSFATRCLAWAAGNISTDELYEDIDEYATENGFTYFKPKDDITC